MAEYVRMPKAHYEAACNSIRAKTGKADKIKSGDMSAEIESITGGGGSSADVRYVTFMSYDGSVEYGKKAVAVGDDCADPIARGVFSKPTRESTAQYNYTFYGWATTPNGGAVSNWSKSITEDKTMYANFSSAVRYYTVTYYDGDTVLKTESLAYGSTPAYVAEKDGYNFEGWEPALATVTGDASYYAQWSSALTFAGASWADIAEVSAAGTAASTFKVGDEKNVQITYADGSTATMAVRIAGFNHDDLADGSGKAGISIVCRTLPDYSTSWNTSNSNCSYGSSLVAKALAEGGDIYNMLPSELTAVIKPVNKKYDNSSSSGTPTLKTVSAPLWALSIDEVGAVGTNASLKPGSDSLSALGTRYALFPSLTLSSGTVKPSFQYLGSITQAQYQSAWLRSVYRVGSYRPKYAYCNTYSNGTYSYGISDVQSASTTQYPIWFGFCI